MARRLPFACTGQKSHSNSTILVVARDRSGAYRYLPQSVNTFLDRDALMALMGDAGFENITQTTLTFGIAVVYVGHV